MIHITFLGTSSMVPTKERNHSSFMLKYENEGLLFDCGEGTQRQLKIASISPSTVTKIFISHWHGDHVLGLPGLLQTLGMSHYAGTLEIYGPKGTKQRIKLLYKAFAFEAGINVKVVEVNKGKVFDGKKFLVSAEPLQHGIPCIGYVFCEKDTWKIEPDKVKKFNLQGELIGKLQEGKSVVYQGKKIKPNDVSHLKKGTKIGFISDTVPCNGAMKIAKDADLLICEATYASKLEEKGEAYGHMTAAQAAQIASQAGSKKLILNHFSQRYKDTNDLLQEAKSIFPNTECAYDFMKVNL